MDESLAFRADVESGIGAGTPHLCCTTSRAPGWILPIIANESRAVGTSLGSSPVDSPRRRRAAFSARLSGWARIWSFVVPNPRGPKRLWVLPEDGGRDARL